MKKKVKIFLIIFTCLFLPLTLVVKADSGWDGDYDYGDSGSNFDFDWNNDYDYSSGSSHYYSGNSDIDVFSIVIAIIFVIIVLVLTALILSKNKSSGSKNNNRILITYDINKIKEILPGFNANEFKQTTYEIYKSVQESWMNFDYDNIKKNTTNELFNLYKSELIALKAKKQKNIMEDFYLMDFDIVDMEKGSDNISIKVRMMVSCKDYVVDKDNVVKRGSNMRHVIYNYEMTFVKGLKEKDNKCPNCNAPLDNVQTSTCPYCNSTVISANHDWVLSKKQVISQK